MKHLSSENTTQTPEHKETELEGQVERITYMNEENGYTVAKVNVPGYPEPVTIVGNLLALAPGEVLEMKGDWETHPKFGRQFKILGHRTVRPSSVKGIRKYLGSGLIRGIGKEMAARIVEKFGEETLKVIDERIDELATVNGIGRKRVKMIKNAWADQKEIRAIMIFLQEHGVGLSHATKIFKRYGQRSIAVV
ncbi:MAG: ATP-dependent RecD-like DNA helicase, partial [Deltaproteobacteria bacterium]|nr:ATP-dependent RecD-like DNA helicase [Deltaproteobacteria bacterium]